MNELQVIDIELIKPHPNNVRRDATPSEELINSVIVKGVLQPLMVTPSTENDTDYLLLAGHRRLAAARAAGQTTVPVMIAHDLVGDLAKQIEVMLVENLQRTDLTPTEEANAYQQLSLLDVSADEIAIETGRSVETVRARLKLAAMPADVKEAVHHHELTLDQAFKLATLESHSDLHEIVLEKIGTDDFNQSLNHSLWKAERRDETQALIDSLRGSALTEYTDETIPENSNTFYIHGDRTLEWMIERVDGFYIEGREDEDMPLIFGVELFKSNAPADDETDEERAAREESEAKRAAQQRAREEAEKAAEIALQLRVETILNAPTGDQTPVGKKMLYLILADTVHRSNDAITWLRDVHGFEFDGNPYSVTRTDIHSFLEKRPVGFAVHAAMVSILAVETDYIEVPSWCSVERAEWKLRIFDVLKAAGHEFSTVDDVLIDGFQEIIEGDEEE